MLQRSISRLFCAGALVMIAALCLCAPRACFAQSSRGDVEHGAFPVEAHESLDALYRGDAGAAIVIARRMEVARAEYPLGYLLEAEAQWWRIYCSALEFKWNHIDVGHRESLPGDAAYLALADKVTELAEIQLRARDSAEMHLYAGMGYVLRVRMHQARQWLARDGIRVSVAGAKLGYDSEASFSRAFKRVMGVAPSHLRNSSGGDHES